MTVRTKKISLISMDEFHGSIGLRSISSCLKEKGFDVQIIFLIPSERLDYSSPLTPGVLAQLSEAVRESLIIGISCMTNEAQETIRVIEFLKKLNIPIVWGGIHATSQPEKCIQYADIICIGEGEEAFSELAETLNDNKPYLKIENFWFKNNGEIIKNPVRNLIDNLDALPFPDYDAKTHFVLEKGKLTTAANKYANLEKIYMHTARGCPNSCNFCCNSFLQKLYQDKGKTIRKISTENIIKSLQIYKERFPGLRYIWFTDDTLFIRTTDELKNFAEKYKTYIKLPFWGYVSPNSINEDKLNLLVDAGLCKLEMGIQSGSENISKNLYNRHISNTTIKKAAELIYKYRNRLGYPNYQIIFCNPYETEKDLLETVHLLIDLPAAYFLQVFPLQFFPASELSKKAEADGLTKERIINLHNHEQALMLNSREKYMNFLLCMMKGTATPKKIGLIPRFFLPKLLNPKVRAFFNTHEIITKMLIQTGIISSILLRILINISKSRLFLKPNV